MSVLIIGGGLSGLIASIRAKEVNAGVDVCVIEKTFPQGNSHIAGQRIRAGIAGERHMPQEEILSLFKSRNGGLLTDQMTEFCEILLTELQRWHQSGVPHQDTHMWFGPQWGDSALSGIQRAHSVLRWFKAKALEKGVHFMSGEVVSLHKNGKRVDSVSMQLEGGRQVIVSADVFVLAGGSSTGLLFKSTNRLITNSPQLLANGIDVGLSGGSITMLHPFGMCSKEGVGLTGCFETDLLTKHKIYDINNNRLTDVEDLLNTHKAHYHFTALCRRIYQTGNLVRMVNAEGREKYGCVSVHYNQLGIITTDGVSVDGVDNLCAVGDASGVNYWTNNAERYPGVALANCIVTGAKCAKIISEKFESRKCIEITPTGLAQKPLPVRVDESIDEVRKLNTSKVVELVIGENAKRSNILADWKKSLALIQQVKDADMQILNTCKSLSNELISHYK